MPDTLASLALSAESLVSRMATDHGNGIPHVQKTLQELEAETAMIAKKHGAAPAGVGALDGASLEARALHREILELEARADYEAETEAARAGDDLDEAVLKRTDDVVIAAIEGAIQDAVEDGEAAALDEHLAAWAKEKEKILEDVGLKALEWAPATPKGAEPMDLATVVAPRARSRRLDDAAARLGALDARQPLNVTTTPSKTGLTSRKTCWYEIAGEWSRLSGEDCVRVDVGTGRMNP
mmetsp:Transcript_560/g.1592  ORF Transcript_560/g.1592 Transcript_560/m.1592 type:complete len:239 (-) Transcript_560:23-739(-)